MRRPPFCSSTDKNEWPLNYHYPLRGMRKNDMAQTSNRRNESNYLRWWTEHIALRNGADNVRLMLPRSVSKVSTGCSKVSLPVRCVMALPS